MREGGREGREEGLLLHDLGELIPPCDTVVCVIQRSCDSTFNPLQPFIKLFGGTIYWIHPHNLVFSVATGV